jgi:hypothetical protein
VRWQRTILWLQLFCLLEIVIGFPTDFKWVQMFTVGFRRGWLICHFGA